MLDDLNRFGMLLLRGSIAVAALFWVLMDEAINRTFYDEDIRPSSLVTEQVLWSVEIDASHDARLPIEASLRNTSGMRLRRITAAYKLEDCPLATNAAADCSPVAAFNETTAVDIAAGLRGRYYAHFNIPNMAQPLGALRLRYQIIKVAGQADPTLGR